MYLTPAIVTPVAARPDGAAKWAETAAISATCGEPFRVRPRLALQVVDARGSHISAREEVAVDVRLPRHDSRTLYEETAQIQNAKGFPPRAHTALADSVTNCDHL